MIRVLFAVSGSDHWTLADRTRHPCGFWPEELVVPHEVFAAAGFEITIATPGGVTPTADEAGFSAAMNGGSEEPGTRFRAYLESIRGELAAAARLEDVDVVAYDLLFVPGGHGPMEDLAATPAFGALVSAFVDAGKLVAAVCHGPAALLPAQDGAGGWCFAGRRVTGFTNDEETQVGFADRAPWLLEDRLRAAGGAFERSDAAWAPHVVVDRGLYTGQNPASSRPLAEELVRALTSAAAAVAWPPASRAMTSAAAGAVRDVSGRTGLLGRVPTGIYVGGAWLSAPDGATFTVEDPAGGGPLAAVADGGPREALAALDSAVAAAPGWAARAPRARSEILARTFELLLERRTQFATLITLESGKPLAEADAEVAYAADFVRWYAEEAVRVDGRYTSSPAGTGRMVVSQRPVGPCYLVTPWNFPLAMATRKLAPALAAGCPVVLKPAELTPLSTLLLAMLIEDAGVPPGVVNIVPTARPAAVSEALLADPRLRKVSFTGSTRVGKRLLELAARNVLRTSMELGGNAPFVIFADADLDAALDGAMQAKFRNAGQACTAANRFLVHATLVDAFAERIAERVAGLAVGPGSRPSTAIGPLIDARAVARIDALVGDALQRGAQLLTGGHPIAGDGHFFEPTVLAGVRPGSNVLREEIFGPVVAISAFDDEDEAVRLANDTEYGLASYVYTRDLARAQRMIDTLESGMTAINVGILSDAAAPFGGMKASGLGREGGYEGIREYLATTYALTADPRR